MKPPWTPFVSPESASTSTPTSDVLLNRPTIPNQPSRKARSGTSFSAGTASVPGRCSKPGMTKRAHTAVVPKCTYFFESLGYMVPDRHMDPYFAEFIPLARTEEPKAHMHPGFEFLYVLGGELELRHGDQECTLEAGDAVYFEAGTPHSYQCAGKNPARVVIVTMHQAPAQAALPRSAGATLPARNMTAKPNETESKRAAPM